MPPSMRKTRNASMVLRRAEVVSWYVFHRDWTAAPAVGEDKAEDDLELLGAICVATGGVCRECREEQTTWRDSDRSPLPVTVLAP